MSALSAAEAGIAAIREAESRAGEAFRFLVEQNDLVRADRDQMRIEIERLRAEIKHLRETMEGPQHD